MKTVEDFAWGMKVVDKNSAEVVVVVAIQPENGKNGSIVCMGQHSFDLICCDPNELEVIK